MFPRGMLLLPLVVVPWLGTTASAEFVDGKPDFFDANLPSPLAYYYLDDGSGYDLKESVSGDPAGGTVLFVEDHQVDSVHTAPNWVNDDEIFGTTIACGKISNKTHPAEGSLQKDTLSLKDVDYGSTGSWAWSVWFRHEKGVNFPNYQREQFFGHGDPTQPTSGINQVHVQYEIGGAVRTILKDSQDADKPSFVSVQNTRVMANDDGAWHHLVLTTRPDGFKGFNVYIDGILEVSSPPGEGANTNPGASGVWLAAGGEAIDPVGPIRLCGREQAQGFNEDRYFRGRVAHFSVWGTALSSLEVSALYFSYTNRFGVSKAPEEEPSPPAEDTCDICEGAPVANPLAIIELPGFPAESCANAGTTIPRLASQFGVTPEEACAFAIPQVQDLCCAAPPPAEPCDICEGQPIANPLTVIDISGFPPESCGKAGVTINNLASQFGVTPEEACMFAIPQVQEICCIPEDGSQAPPEVLAESPTAAPAAPAPTATDETSTAGAMADVANPVASDGISPGAIAGIVIGSIALVAAIVLVVTKNGKSSSSSTEYDTNAPAIKAAIADQKELEKELPPQDSDTEKASNGASKDTMAPV